MRSSFGTIHSTRRRVVLPLAVSLSDERFTCPKQDCRISVNTCGNRHHLASSTHNAHLREALDGCSDCVIGEANLAGLPMPSLDSITSTRQEKRMQSSEATAESGQPWKQRTCARDHETVFTPATRQQKACGTCGKCKAAEGNGGKARPRSKPPARIANGKASAIRRSAPTQAIVTPIAARVPANGHVAHAGDYPGVSTLLERFGFRDVAIVDTPAGRMLVAMVAAGSA